MQVIIRPLQVKDAYTSVRWRNDSEVFKYTGNTYNHEILLETELEWINRIIHNRDEYRCAIEVDGVYVGNIYLTNIEKGTADYHIFIGDKSYWGKGVAKRASQLIIDYGFNILKLTQIFLRVKKANTSALHLYERLGFVIIREDGEWFSMKLTNNTIED